MDLLNKLKSMLGEETTPENVTEEISSKSCDCADEGCNCEDKTGCNCTDGTCENCKPEETNE